MPYARKRRLPVWLAYCFVPSNALPKVNKSIAQVDDNARQRECGIGRPDVVEGVSHREARFPHLKTIEGLDFALQSSLRALLPDPSRFCC